MDRVLESDSKRVAIGRMGIGWIVKEEGLADRNISFSSSLKNWPFSIWAELGAIWSALLIAPYEVKIHIFTDSKAVIEAIKKYNINNKTHS